jgi:hypothetical protein
MASEGGDGRALALSLFVVIVIAHRPNRVIQVTVRYGKPPEREVQEGLILMLLREVHEEYCE